MDLGNKSRTYSMDIPYIDALIQIYFDETKSFLLGFLAYHEKALNQLGKDIITICQNNQGFI